MRESGGASRSLLLLIDCLRRMGVEPKLLAPRGPVLDEARSRGVSAHGCMGLSVFAVSEHGAYAGRRWLLVYRTFVFAITTLLALVKIRATGYRPDLVHVNEYALFPSALLAKMVFHCPVVLHCRSRLLAKRYTRSKVAGWFVKRLADHVIAIDHNVASTVPDHPSILVVHNGTEFSNADVLQSKGSKVTHFGLVANFLKNKGIMEFVRAGALLKKRGLHEQVHLHIFGHHAHGSRRWLATLMLRSDAEAVDLEAVQDIMRADGTEEMFTLHGFERNPKRIFGRIDVLCFPSHLNAVGRPVFEAAAFGVPSIVAFRDRETDDAIVHDVTGVVVPDRDAVALARAMEWMHCNPAERVGLGLAARAHCERIFDVRTNTRKVYDIYSSMLKGATIERRC